MSDLLQIARLTRPRGSQEPAPRPSGRPWLRSATGRVARAGAAPRAWCGSSRSTPSVSRPGCPNLPECWARGTATFMIGGKLCTRRCGFCDVPDRPARPPLDAGRAPPASPRRSRTLGLRFAVVTAVARDDLRDGGAAHFAATLLEAVHERAPGCRVEVLIPDFKGLEEVAAHGPRRRVRTC